MDTLETERYCRACSSNAFTLLKLCETNVRIPREMSKGAGMTN